MALKRVQQSNAGVYVATSHGVPIDDGEGHFLLIDSYQYDLKRINILVQTAKDLGYENVGYEFLDSVRKVDDEEYLVQQQRMEMGLQPDPYDIGDIMASRRKYGNNGNK